MVPSIVPILAGSLLAAGCLFGAFFNLRRKRIIDDLPTSKTQGVFIGQVELKGTAECEKPLTSFLSSVKCVQYAWKVEEHWSRTVVETYSDSKGTHTRTRTESGWKTVASGGEETPFYLKDETGVIRIVPEGAKIQGDQTYSTTCTPSDPIYYGKGPAGSIANSTHRRRFNETAIPLHKLLYVTGKSRERQDVVAPEIAKDKNKTLFLISVRSEKEISRGYSLGYWLFSISGLLCAVIGGAAWAYVNGMTLFLLSLPVLIMTGGYLIVFLLGLLWFSYNSLINLRQRVQQSWSEVDVQLKRRNDLIPNLVAVVENYKGYESEIQKVVTELRNQIAATPPGMSGPDHKGLAPVLRVIIERYPELKANSLFTRLQRSLVDTEQRIALARDYYNDTATFYNTRLQIIPERYVASLAGLRQRSLMTASDFERAPLVIKLAE